MTPHGRVRIDTGGLTKYAPTYTPAGYAGRYELHDHKGRQLGTAYGAPGYYYVANPEHRRVATVPTLAWAAWTLEQHRATGRIQSPATEATA